ncbi:MAG: hypothetical protein WB762_23730 [Candidatus Sulfotelmatobacter sp.]
MIYGFHVDVLFGATYAIFLVTVAAILERVALHSHRLSRQMEVAGFKFHTVHDRWECPTGQYLERHQTDHHLRIVTYRAPAHACNVCHCRENCTDSEDGRRIEHRLDSWLQSEIRRFHRGISLLLLLLAGLILAAEVSNQDTFRDWTMILGLLLPIATFGTRLLTVFLARTAEGSQGSTNPPAIGT